MAVDKKFIINRQGKDYVLYAGLLQEAHKQFGEEFEITTEILELEPKPILRAKFRGVSKDAKRQVKTSGIGTAKRQGDEKSPAARTAPIEMAETRAKARALRDATNIGMTAFEELGGDEEDTQPSQAPRSRQGQSKGKAPQPQNAAGSEAPVNRESEQQQEALPEQGSEEEMGEELATSQQIDAIERLLDRVKEDGESKEDAVEKMEEYLGYPLALMTSTKAESLKKSLQNKANKRAKEKAEG